MPTPAPKPKKVHPWRKWVLNGPRTEEARRLDESIREIEFSQRQWIGERGRKGSKPTKSIDVPKDEKEAS